MDVSPLEDRLLGGSMPSVGELQVWEDAALRTLQLTSCIRQFWHGSARQVQQQSPHQPPPGLPVSHTGQQMQQPAAHQILQQLPGSDNALHDPPQSTAGLQSSPVAAAAGLACQSGRPALHGGAADAGQSSLAVPLRLPLTGPSVTSPDVGLCKSAPAADCKQPPEGLQVPLPATVTPPTIMAHLGGGPAGVLSNLPAAAASAAGPKSVCAP